jgi:hypothetical protein
MTSNLPTNSIPSNLTADQLAAILNTREHESYDDEGVIRDPHTGRITHNDNNDGPEDLLNVVFSTEALYSSPATWLAGGVPQYVDVDFVTIQAPGDTSSVIHTQVTDYYQWRFPVEYAAFKAGKAEVIEGTPLSHWPLLSPSQRKSLESNGVRTVEQLAKLADSNGAGLAQFHSLKAKAAQFLAQAKELAEVGKSQLLIEEMANAHKAEMDALKAQMTHLMAMQMASGQPAPEALPEPSKAKAK